MGKSKPPADSTKKPSSGVCACSALRKASRAVTQLYDNELRPSGIRATQYSILLKIEAAGEASLTQLTSEMVMDQTTLTRSLRLLEQLHLLERVSNQDGRLKVLTLTSKGKNTVIAARALWRNAQRKMKQTVGGEWNETLRCLNQLVVAAQRHSA